MMDFKEFRRLYTGDPATLHITMELLLQNGRELLLGTTESEIVSSLQCVLQNFFTGEKLREMAGIAKRLAALETSVLLDYMKRAALAAEKDREPEAVTLTSAEADGRALGIDLGYAVLETSVTLPEPDAPVEVGVKLVFPGGERQDIAMVRPTEPRPGCEVLVWTEPEDDDYTAHFHVAAREEDLVS